MADTAGTWYVVKYMSDLRRREPRNVGVALLTAEGWLTRFYAEVEDGVIDGRRLRRRDLKKPIYEAWVQYYRRRLVQDGGIEQVSADQIKRRGNFFMELGGHLLEVRGGWSAELADLYRLLVDDTEDEPGTDAGFHLKESIEAIFRAVQIDPIREVTIEAAYRSGGAPSPIKFDYEYVNGTKHLMDAVSLASPSAVALAQSFESRAAAVRHAGLAADFVAFVSTEHSRGNIEQALMPLEAQAVVVDVDDKSAAIDQLHSLIS